MAEASPFEVEEPDPPPPPTNGEELHMQILDRHPRLSSFYWSPHTQGELSTRPLITIAVPMRDYRQLNRDELRMLALYARSLVHKARERPWDYIHAVSRGAPLARRVEGSIRNLEPWDWGFVLGAVSGQDILTDRVLPSEKIEAEITRR